MPSRRRFAQDIVNVRHGKLAGEVQEAVETHRGVESLIARQRNEPPVVADVHDRATTRVLRNRVYENAQRGIDGSGRYGEGATAVGDIDRNPLLPGLLIADVREPLRTAGVTTGRIHDQVRL